VTLNHFSYIDSFLVSDSIAINTNNFRIHNYEPNLFDHLPVCFELNYCSISNADINILNQCSYYSLVTNFHLRWDHADLLSYYDITRVGLQPLLDEISKWPSCNCTASLSDKTHISQVSETIDKFYSRIVAVLLHASQCKVPVIKINAIEYWWNGELDCLKRAAIFSNAQWVSNGRPRSGPIYNQQKK